MEAQIEDNINQKEEDKLNFEEKISDNEA